MTEHQLHPSVKQFKEFINRHPKLRVAIRTNEYPLQELYEKWVLLGEDDPIWDQYKEPPTIYRKRIEKGAYHEFIQQIIDMTKNIDVDKLTQHIEQVNAAIGIIQNLLGQFQHNHSEKQLNDKDDHNHLFHIFKD